MASITEGRGVGEIKLTIRLSERPQLTNPVLLGGIPDSGNVAKVALDYLISRLDARRFGEIYCDAFPAQVLIHSNGTADLLKNELYYKEFNGSSPDLILFTGDSQPESPQGAYQICNEVLSLARDFGVQTVYTVGAHIMGVFVERPKVYMTATDPSVLPHLKSFGALTMDQGSITWMNGLLFGLAKAKDMVGIFISAETSGYIVDAKAAEALISFVSRVLGFSIDMAGIQEKASETERAINIIQSRQFMEQPSTGPRPEVYR